MKISKINSFISKIKVPVLVILMAILFVTVGTTCIAFSPKLVTVIDKDSNVEIEYQTKEDTVGEFLVRNGIILGDFDAVIPGRDQSISGNMEIVIKRAKRVVFKQAGQEKVIYTSADTVADFVKEQGIVVDVDDYTIPDKNTIIEDNMTVEYVEVLRQLVQTIEKIPYTVQRRPNPKLIYNVSNVVQKGSDGEKMVTVAVMYENGVEVSRETISENIYKEVVDEIVEYGVVVSSRGEELRYTRVIDCTATAYTDSVADNGIYVGQTATCMKPSVGVIAVDPKVIPLYTRLYVESIDGSWTYGYCIAGDTGGAIKGNKVDLFFDTSNECVQFGRRPCRVYILE